MNSPKSYEEKLSECPIHARFDIDGYLAEALVPPQFWRPFHEFVLAFGLDFPTHPITPAQYQEFNRSALEICRIYQIPGTSAMPLKIMFKELIIQWEPYQGNNPPWSNTQQAALQNRQKHN